MSQRNSLSRLDVARGAIIGSLVGDAAGATLEFIGRKPTPGEVDNAMRMVGGGVWNTAPGQVTDDGELTLALALALADQNQYSPKRVAQFYRRWRMSHPFDIGQATSAALSMGDIDATDLAEIVFENARKYNSESKANGSLMRATPLGVWAANIDPSDSINAARLDAKLTHPNPTCQWACVAYVMAIRHLMLNPGDAPGAFSAAEHSLTGEESDEVRNWLHDAQISELPSFYPLAGFVRIGFTYAFYHLINGTSYADAIYATLSGGGDTDTNACIVGGMVGAANGIESIPPHMLNSIITCDTTNGRHRPDWLSTKNVEQIITMLVNQQH